VAVQSRLGHGSQFELVLPTLTASEEDRKLAGQAPLSQPPNGQAPTEPERAGRVELHGRTGGVVEREGW